MAILRELKLDPDGDLDLTNGSISFLEEGAAVGQRCSIRLQALFGEWRFNRLLGTPWLQQLLGSAFATPQVIRSIIKRRLTETQGVQSIAKLDVIIDRRIRKLTINATVIAGDAPTPVNVVLPF